MALPVASPMVAVSPRARRAYLVFYAACRSIHTSSPAAQFDRGQFHRSDFSGQGFTGFYEPGGPTIGPLGDASAGEPLVTPRLLKDHLDQFVVGQERSKKILSVAVYNHYQRVQELQRKEEEEQALYEQAARRAEAARHPVEGEYPGQNATVNSPSFQASHPTPESQIHPRYTTPPPTQSLLDPGAAPVIEKSNVLLLGPSGVGKTLMAKTLARILDVPFSISDCTPFTQAGYIGEDVEVCVQRLLAAANYDVARAERGIICLDEVDKIATAKVSHGKDVSGEGVQQALLKIIEGTTVQVQAKAEKGSSTGSPGRNAAGYNPTSGPGGAGQSNQQQQQLNKGDVYNINTDNVLFICTGAFIGLHKVIMDRIAKGSIGFGARVRTSVGSPDNKDNNDPTVPADKTTDELFKKHLPFYSDVAAVSTPPSSNPTDLELPSEAEPATYNTLDLTTPSDLQKYGLIPELIGRIPTVCALSPLSLPSLVRVLTEPRNSLVSQYVHLFSLSNMTLHLTTPALWEIARGARAMGTGARGLRAGMERCLAEAMFDGPGSGARFCLVDEAVAKKLRAPWLFHKREANSFQDRIRAEEEEWLRRKTSATGEAGGDGANVPTGPGTFEEYRERVRIAGSG